DLRLAKEYHLIPKDVDWARWSKFHAGFRNLADKDVAKRYSYDQRHLARRNWATRIFRLKSTVTCWFHEEPYWSTLPYIWHAAEPLAFIFASVSLILSSVQIIL
ncbi:hypothetical protein B0J13DRAFT_413082, partial [Dactylonectria estremocensis]